MNLYFLIIALAFLLLISLYFNHRLYRQKYIIKVPIPDFSRFNFLGDFIGHVYGILGLVGLGITIVSYYNAYTKIPNTEFQLILKTLTNSFALIVLAFIFASAYFIRKLHMYKQYQSEVSIVENKLNTQYIINKYQSELIHSIFHYQRNIIARLFDFTADKNSYSDENITELKKRFQDFLVILTSNIQSYFSFITNDNCSVTIKKVEPSKQFVSTFFRDPVNLKKRKIYDEEISRENGGRYKISENTAFRIITDPKLKNNFFYEDDLNDLYSKELYINSNKDWKKLYNATIVVPISTVINPIMSR